MTPDKHRGDRPLDPSAVPGARKAGALARFVQPELATLVEEAPQGGEWLHEVKFDGYRALARIERGGVEMYSRTGKDWTSHWALLAQDLARLPVETALLDGEVVVQMPDGTTSFQGLQKALGTDRSGRFPRDAAPATDSVGAEGRPSSGGRLLYYVFDLLYLDGYDLLESPLEARKELLRRLLAEHPGGPGVSRVVYSDHVAGGGRELLRQACRLGLEGMVSKRAGSRYRPGARGADWQKAKCRHEQEFVVGGFTDSAGARTGFGALLLGVYEEGALRYVGKVGTGFNEGLLLSLGERLRALEVEEPSFQRQLARAPRHAHWVKPELVVQVAFAEWTGAGGLSHPSFKGMRQDKPAAEVVGEKAGRSR